MRRAKVNIVARLYMLAFIQAHGIALDNLFGQGLRGIRGGLEVLEDGG